MPTVSFLLSLKAILNTIYSKFWNFDFLLFTASATYHLVSIINQALELWKCLFYFTLFTSCNQRHLKNTKGCSYGDTPYKKINLHLIEIRSERGRDGDRVLHLCTWSFWPGTGKSPVPKFVSVPGHLTGDGNPRSKYIYIFLNLF